MTDRELEKSFTSTATLLEHLRNLGCEQALVKLLAANQDNEKNQINLGGSAAIMDFFPGVTGVRGVSTSTKKAHSQAGGAIPETILEFAWIWPDGGVHRAPEARVINYYQYPEVRFSGFLRGCQRAPRALRRDEMDLYGRRALILGFAGEKVYGTVVTDADGEAIVNQLGSLAAWPVSGLLRVLPVPDSTASFDAAALQREIVELFGVEHPACELRDPKIGPVPARSQRGAGLTLEALLGIAQNALSGPDKHGFEVKAVGTDRVTIITTEPDIGSRVELGLRAYLDRFGWQAVSADKAGWRVFNGYHKFGQLCRPSNAILSISHWDELNNAPTWDDEPRVLLTHKPSGELISGWTYDHLKNHWSRKHSGALYVEARSINRDGGRYPSHYKFGPRYLLGVGTSPVYLLQQIASQRVILDPADDVNAKGKVHARTQWRVPGPIRRERVEPWRETQLPSRLSYLYDSLDVVDVDGETVIRRIVRGQYVPSSS